MNRNSGWQDQAAFRELLQRFHKLRQGVVGIYLEEEDFERIINFLLDDEKYDQGLAACEIAITQHRFSASLLTLKAETLCLMHQYQDAFDLTSKAMTMDNSFADIYVVRADAAMELGFEDQVQFCMDTILQQFEGIEKIEALFELSEVFDDHEAFDLVFECMKAILKTDPNQEEALYKICFWTDYTGRSEDSIRLHKEILEENPFNELAWFNLGTAYQGIKLYEKAIDAYQYAVSINQKFDYAYRNMGDAYIRLKKYKEAIESLEKVLEFAMPESLLYEAIGHCYERLGKFAQARLSFKKAAHINPDDVQISLQIARTYMFEQRWDKAIPFLEATLKQYPMQPDANLALARCFRATARYEEALPHFGNLLQIRPKNLQGWQGLLGCLLDMKAYKDGIDCCMLAWDQTGGKPIFYCWRAVFQLASGAVKQAAEQIDSLALAYPKLIKNLLQIYPEALQHPAILEVLNQHKLLSKRRSRKG
jgi:tetratricopeptide (TPR) repeat protein